MYGFLKCKLIPYFCMSVVIPPWKRHVPFLLGRGEGGAEGSFGDGFRCGFYKVILSDYICVNEKWCCLWYSFEWFVYWPLRHNAGLFRMKHVLKILFCMNFIKLSPTSTLLWKILLHYNRACFIDGWMKCNKTARYLSNKTLD